MQLSSKQPLHPHLRTFLWPALVGGAIGLLLILSFVLSVDNPDPDWPRWWRVRPLIIVPLAGAAGGAAFHYLLYLRRVSRLPAVLAIVLGILVFVVGLWLGIVLGLDGTLWD
ncbi:potassium transporter KefB [Neolewinella litorea]|uniref:Potassium transporter KefB n=1 Tax=Neolewinella litorea TaxID=2562452 RepID=A0A4S4N9C1_9BACT|nr:potassium transporter KefB [Neolewinella litorea]THH34601.1 potassium transporter KefB [Neolewinella litorea]